MVVGESPQQNKEAQAVFEIHHHSPTDGWGVQAAETAEAATMLVDDLIQSGLYDTLIDQERSLRYVITPNSLYILAF